MTPHEEPSPATEKGQPPDECLPVPEPPLEPSYQPPPDRRDRPFPEPPPPPPHPDALRWLKRIHWATAFCWTGVRRCVILALLVGAPIAAFARAPHVALALLALAAFFAVSHLLLLVLHLFLLTFFFATYSLGQFMSVLLLAGLGVSLAVTLEDEWRILAIVGLVALFGIVMVYVGSYDPITGNSIIPRAAREVLFNPPDVPKPKTSPDTDEGSDSGTPPRC